MTTSTNSNSSPRCLNLYYVRKGSERLKKQKIVGVAWSSDYVAAVFLYGRPP